jgi:adenylate cyclase
MNTPTCNIPVSGLTNQRSTPKRNSPLADLLSHSHSLPSHLKDTYAGLRMFLLVSLFVGVALCFLQYSELFFKLDSLLLSLDSKIHYNILPTGFMILLVMFHTLLPGILILEEGVVKGIIYTVVIWFFYAVLLHSYSSSLAFYIPLSAPLIGCFLSSLRVIGWKHTFLKQEQEDIKKTLGSFVEPKIADILLSNPDLINQNGVRTTVTIMFADLRGFTKLCEIIPPEQVIEMLRDCFGKFISIVRANGGIVDKLMGDSMMVVWGNPVPMENHAEKAVESAIEMQAMMQVLKKKWAQKLGVEIMMGIGINTDEVVAGTIGSAEFCDYTVLGCGVNLASSIESVCPGDMIYVSERTFSQLNDSFECRKISNLSIKNGVSIPAFQVIS